MRISVSDVDSFRYWRDSEDGDLSELLSRLRREAPATEAMVAGKALHKALELSPSGDFTELKSEGYLFTIETDCELSLPDIRELKATKEYAIDNLIVTLVGMVDAVHGKRVDDHKTTSRFDAERFLDSFQWRAYLDIFNADHFRWNVFEMTQVAAKEYRVFGFHRLEQYRYPTMLEDIERDLTEFVRFARVHLPERFDMQRAA